MPLKYPDIFEPNNQNNAQMDSEFVRGGIKIVADLTSLYALSTGPGNGKYDQLKQNATRAYVQSNAKYYVLTDITNCGNSNGWTQESSTVSFAQIQGNATDNTSLATALNAKVDKITGMGLSTNDFTSAYKSKLDGLSNYFIGRYTSLSALQAAYPTGTDGQYGIVDVNSTTSNIYIWDSTAGGSGAWTLSSSPGNVTSVNTLTGAVVLTTDNIGEGTTNLYFTNARVKSYADTLYQPKGNYATAATTLAGYGITDAYTTTYIDGHFVSLSGSYSDPAWLTGLGWSKILSKPTTVSGYGITDAALDATVVHLAGSETITGTKTFNNGITAPSIQGSNAGAQFIINSTELGIYDNASNSVYVLPSGVQYNKASTYNGTLTWPTVTANRTINLPDKNGTVALTSDISALSTSYQPLENQRLSTTNSPTFTSLILNNALTMQTSSIFNFQYGGATGTNGAAAGVYPERLYEYYGLNWTIPDATTNGTYKNAFRIRASNSGNDESNVFFSVYNTGEVKIPTQPATGATTDSVVVWSNGLLKSVAQSSIATTWASITSKPTTIAGYGITDAVPYTGATNYVDLGTNEIYAGASEIGGTWSGGAAGGFYNLSPTGQAIWIKGGSSTSHNTDFYDYNNNLIGYINGDGSVHFNGTITAAGFNSGSASSITAITLNTPGVLFNTPVNYTVSGSTATGTLSLKSQSAYNVLATGSASGTPSFVQLNSTYLTDKNAAGGFVGLDGSRNATIAGGLTAATLTTSGTAYLQGAELRLQNGSGGYYSRTTRTSSNNYVSLNNQVTTPGGVGKAIYLSGTAYVGYNDTGINYASSTGWSIGFWVNATQTGSGTLVTCFTIGSTSVNNGGASGQLSVALLGTNFRITAGTRNDYYGATFNTNTWYYITITRNANGGALNMYTNGVLVATDSAIASFQIVPDGITKIGDGAGIAGGQAKFDQFVFYNTVLTQAQIQSIYNSGGGTATLPGTPYLVYNFEEGAGTVIQDAQGNLNGTAYNSPTWTNNGIAPNGGGVLAEVEYLKNINGIINGEYSQTTIGDYNSGTIIQGKRVSFYINGGYPVWGDNFGRVRLDPMYNGTLNADGSATSANLHLGAGTASVPQMYFTPSSDPTAGLNTGNLWYSTASAGFKGYDGGAMYRIPKMSDVSPSTNYGLVYNGSYWVPTASNAGGGLLLLDSNSNLSASFSNIALTTPSAPTLATATTGGSINGSQTIYVKVVAVDINGGLTLPSAEASIAIPATTNTNTVTVTITAVNGAASYRVYYGTATGSETSYQTTTTTSLVISTLTGTAGSVPSTANAYVNYFNSTGISTGKLTAPTLTLTNLTGSGNRLLGIDPTGTLTTYIQNIPYVITDSNTITLLTTESNWNSTDSYVGTALTVTYQQQVYTDGNYLYLMYNDNAPYRIPIYKLQHIVSSTSAPTIAAGAAAGTSPTVSITGNNVTGIITVTTGTTPTANAVLATISYSKAYGGNGGCVSIEPANANANALYGPTGVYVPASSESTTQFQLYTGTSALAASTQYQWRYLIAQR